MRSVLAVVVLAVVVAACTGSERVATPPGNAGGDLAATQGWGDAGAAEAAVTWANELGIVRVDEGLWKDRVDEVCDLAGRPADPNLPASAYTELAGAYLEADAAYSTRADAPAPTVAEAADTLQRIARSVCS